MDTYVIYTEERHLNSRRILAIILLALLATLGVSAIVAIRLNWSPFARHTTIQTTGAQTSGSIILPDDTVILYN